MTGGFVSVIIPTYNDWARLALCIKALSKQSYPQEQFEVVIVNNNPDEKEPADLFLPNNFKIITEAKPGSYAARNAALKIVQGDIIAFTDSDCIPDQDWITNAISYFKKHKGCSRVAGHISIFSNTPKPTVTDLYNSVFEFPQVAYTAAGTGVTANLFVYKKVFDTVGPFDDKLFSLGDLEWGKLAHKAGFQIDYVEDVVVKHPSRTFTELITKVKRIGGGQARFNKKNKFYSFLSCVNDALPKPYIIINIFKESKHLSLMEKLKVALLRYYLIYIRATEKYRVIQGKVPVRT